MNNNFIPEIPLYQTNDTVRPKRWITDPAENSVGDLLLEQATVRISSCLREADTVIRLREGEFAVVIRDEESVPHLQRLMRMAGCQIL